MLYFDFFLTLGTDNVCKIFFLDFIHEAVRNHCSSGEP